MSKVTYPRLTKGNAKLGGGIYGWSIPAGETCPGRSAACAACYAMRGQFVRPNVVQLHVRNYRASRSPHFVGRMRQELRRLLPRVVRIHVAGDFYSPEYVAAWRSIADSEPHVRFYAYTRSWRVATIAPALAQLAQLANVRLWYSADHDTGTPAALPPGVRVAWLQLRTAEPVPHTDLVFRDRGARSVPVRRIGLAIVCPVESATKAADTDCTRCGICWYR